jgi:hypothetical protein
MKRISEGVMEVQAIAQDLEMTLGRQKEAMLELQRLLRGDEGKQKGES